jgi:uncharacterized protein YigA (DUF484 family)
MNPPTALNGLLSRRDLFRRAGHGAGLLALASPDAGRYHPGMSTDFLTRIAELLSAALATAISGPSAV